MDDHASILLEQPRNDKNDLWSVFWKKDHSVSSNNAVIEWQLFTLIVNGNSRMKSAKVLSYNSWKAIFVVIETPNHAFNGLILRLIELTQAFRIK